MPKVSKQGTNQGSAGSIRSRIRPVSVDSNYLRMLVYGKQRTGKTSLAGTFPKPILHLVCSSIGLDESLSLRGSEGIDDLEIISSSDLDQLAEIVGDYKTVVLDHATGLQDLILREILGLKELPQQLGWGVVSIVQWSQCSLQTKERLRQILTRPCHVLILAQEREFNVEDELRVLTPYVGAALTPSTAGWLYPACSHILQSFLRRKTIKKKVSIAGKEKEKEVITDEVEYCLRVGPDPVYTTGVRVPRGKQLPSVIVDPSFDKLAELLDVST